MRNPFLPLFVAALASVGVLSGLSVAATASGASRVDFALQARDAAGNPLVTLHGKSLHRLEAFSLSDASGEFAGVPEVVFQSKDSLVLALPEGIAEGPYSLLLEGRRESMSVSVVVRNDFMGPGSVRAEHLDPWILQAIQAAATRTELLDYAKKADLSDYASKADLAPLAPRALKGARATCSGGTGTGWTAVSFDGTEFDTDECRSYGTPERIACGTDGYYAVTARLLLPTGAHEAELRLNGQKVSGDRAYSSVLGSSIVLQAVVAMKKYDYVEVWVKATNGGDFSVVAGTEFSMVKVGE